MDEFEQLNEESSWEERSLNFLQDSNIDQVLSPTPTKSGRKKHRIRWMKKPMAIPEVILELQDKSLRESALRCLCTFLLDKREEDPENYYITGYLLYYSCSTMAILLQEVMVFYQMMVDGSLNARISKRLLNVLTLFQCVAANKETRHKFVDALVPNYLVPIILFQFPAEEVFENVRAVALSVFGILCQTREPKIIQWALQNDVVEVCRMSIENGNELSKVIAMHILEAIMQNDLGMLHLCSPVGDSLLQRLMTTWRNVVYYLAADKTFSPRLLFHIIRCYVLLCTNARGFALVVENLPAEIRNGSFDDITQEYPMIGSLVQQLLLSTGNIGGNCNPSAANIRMNNFGPSPVHQIK